MKSTGSPVPFFHFPLSNCERQGFDAAKLDRCDSTRASGDGGSSSAHDAVGEGAEPA
jgi:hypothetical protein